MKTVRPPQERLVALTRLARRSSAGALKAGAGTDTSTALRRSARRPAGARRMSRAI